MNVNTMTSQLTNKLIIDENIIYPIDLKEINLDKKYLKKNTENKYKFFGKSVMSSYPEMVRNTTFRKDYDSYNYSKDTLSKTLLEEIIFNNCPQHLINKCSSYSVVMNDKFLFTNCENILNEEAVEINDKKQKNGGYKTTYSLSKIEDNTFIQNKTFVAKNELFKPLTKFKYSFDFKGHCYDSDKIYKIHKNSSNKLEEICSLYLNDIWRERLPLQIQLIKSTSTTGKNTFNLIHNSNNTTIKRFMNYSECEEITSNIFINNNCQQVHNTKVEPIYVKLKMKNVKITHLGFLGSKIPILSCVKSKIFNKYARNKKCSEIINSPCYIFDTSEPIGFVKKIEIWFKSLKTKKWVFLKNTTLNFNGLNSCFEEDIIPIFSNFNDFTGLETIELKIIPTEFINTSDIRIAVYGIIPGHVQNNKNNDEDCEIVNYCVNTHTPLSPKYILKHGGFWSRNSEPHLRSKGLNKQKSKEMNKILSEI
jgi:tRNA G10  N-methylase Trm11